jgi:hypothetical protein
MAILPLIARFVWLLVSSPSEENLCRSVFKLSVTIIVDKVNALIVDQQCRVGQVISPGCQQMVLFGLVGHL